MATSAATTARDSSGDPVGPGTSLRRPVGRLLLFAFAVVAALALAGNAFAEGGPAITSDKADYAPGEQVALYGSFWGAGESVHINVNDDAGQSWSHDADVLAGLDGSFTYEFNLPDWFVAEYTVRAIGSGGLSAATTFTDANFASLQGRSCASPCSGSPATPENWVGGNVQNWRELDTIPFRALIDAKASDVNTVTPITVTYERTNGGKPGIENVIGFASTDNTKLQCLDCSNPTRNEPTGAAQWSVTFNVKPLVAGEQSITFSGRLAAGSHLNTGSSLSMGGTPALGTLQVSKPGAKPGSPDLTVSKSGPSTTGSPSTISYSLTYSNKASATSSATGVQVTDTLPSGLTFKSGTCSPACSVSVDLRTIVWTVGTVAPGAGATLTFDADVASGLAFGTTVTNNVQILSAENDAVPGDNSASKTTTISFNRAPSATPQSVSTAEDTAKTITLAGSDPDADSLTFKIASLPPHGKLYEGGSVVPVNEITAAELPKALSGNQVTYDPALNYNGADSFNFKANDGSLDSAAATVSIAVSAVNDPPHAVDDDASGTEDADKTISKASLLANDSDSDSAGLSLTAVSNPLGGTVEISGDDVVFDPAANLCGDNVASFEYTVSDGSLSDTGKVTLDLACVNDEPTLDAIADKTVNEDAAEQTVSLSGIGSGAANESQTLAVTASSSNTALIPHPTVVYTSPNATGSLKYTPVADQHGSAIITVKVNDGGGTANGGDEEIERTFKITVTPVNDEPTASNGSLSTDEDTAKSIDLGSLAGDLETSDANLTYTIVAGPSNGQISGSGAMKTYTPNLNYNGSDSFTYKVTDRGDPDGCGAITSTCAGPLSSPTKTLSITVNAVNDAPDVGNNSGTRSAKQFSDAIDPVTISATDVDSAADGLSASISGWKKQGDPSYAATPALGGSGLALTANAPTSSFPRTWTISGNAMVAAGTYVVRVEVKDATNAAAETLVTIVVTKEDASIEYTGDSFKNTKDANTTTATVTLAAVVREAGAAGGPSESPVALGNALIGKQVKFTVYTFTNAPYGTPCTVTITSGTSTATVSCSVTLKVDDPYTVVVELLDNPHYLHTQDDGVVTVAYPGTGFTTGGGWLLDPNTNAKSNFGFTVKRQKNGGLQGNSLFIYRRSNFNLAAFAPNASPAPPNGLRDYNFRVKSNSWVGGALQMACTTTVPMKCTATFAGKNNIQAIDRLTGVLYSLGGGYSYQVDVDDYAEPGSTPGAGPDGYAIRTWDGGGTYYQVGMPRAWTSDPVKLWDPAYTGYGSRLAINGGNIQVRP